MTAIEGLRIGHATDAALKSGTTVFLPDKPAIAAVHVSGGAPATRETDLLKPGNLVERVDAIVLSGGSAFGLAAADGVMAWLAAQGRGFPLGRFRVPIVPGACLFDLANGGDKSSLSALRNRSVYAEFGSAACAAAAGEDVPVGSKGAGVGATTADLKGGFGAATTFLASGARLSAFAAVNALGRITLGASGHFRAALFEENREFGGLGLPSPLPPDAAQPVVKGSPALCSSTTLGVIATDCDLTRVEAERVAIAAHDGIALAVFPAHTPYDGDAVFALATGVRPLPDRPRALIDLCAAAAATLARAISVAVYAAEPAEGDVVPAWRERYGGLARQTP